MDRPEFDAHRLAAIVEWSDDAIYSIDLDGIVTSWNLAAERHFGYTAAEIVGQSVHLIIPEDRRAEERLVVDRIRSNQSIRHFETVRRAKDGMLIDVSLTASPIRDEHGVIVGASKIARDITDRKRATEALADLQRRLLTLVSASASLLGSPKLENVQVATISTARDLLTADGYALWRLEAATGVWRMARADGVSNAFASRLVSAEAASASLAAVLGDDPMVIPDVLAEPRLRARHDAYRSEGIRSMLVLPLAAAGTRSGTLVFYYRAPHAFTSAEVQAGQALANLAAAAIRTAELYELAEHGKQQARFLARAGALAASSLDYEKTLTAVAQLAVPDIADWCAVDLMEGAELKRVAVAHVDPAKVSLARELQERYPADPNAAGGLHEVIRSGRPSMMATIPRETIVAAARDPEHLRLLTELSLTSYMCVPLVARGRSFGALTFVSAESGRHYSPDDVEFAQDLASRAALAIDNARAYGQLDQANRLKDDFLATLSHELRTPLGAVLGYTRMLSMKMLDTDKQDHALTVIDRNAKALHQIIEDVLDVSRIASGKLRLNVQTVDLADVVTNAIATVRPAADAKSIRIHSILDQQVPPVSGDPERLQQVAWNLLSNAVKFTPKGGQVQVQLRRINSHVELVVSDTGQGIAPDFLPHLFERFRQADSTFSRRQGGLGLGLAIARQLVELHGGTVHAASGGPGTGATFTVTLPLAIVHRRGHDHDQNRSAAALSETSALLPHRLDGVSVLAVDDERDALGLLQTILESAGARVAMAHSGQEAIDALAQRVPDAIIADLGMPGMDGLEFIRRVRAQEGAARHVPAAALTAYARSEDRVRALASGFQMHMAKPVDPTELVVAVASLVKRQAD